MTLSSITALFATMVVLASIPSISVLTVTARSASSGFIHGVFTTFGIVAGDILFILLAIFGLTILADTMGSMFVLAKYIGAAYLIWFGTKLWRSKYAPVAARETIESSLLSSFLAGLFITLGDQKAILFYLGFFPAFIDISSISYFDVGLIIVITIVAVGGVKLGYAFMAHRTSLFFNNTSIFKTINLTAGTVMIGIGILLIATA